MTVDRKTVSAVAAISAVLLTVIVGGHLLERTGTPRTAPDDATDTTGTRGADTSVLEQGASAASLHRTPEGRPADAHVTFRHGNTTTYDGVLIAAGATGAPGDTAEATVWCAGQPCPHDNVTWDLGGVAHTGNPLEVTHPQPGLHTLTVDVAGRPTLDRTFTVAAAPRAADWPIDAVGDGATPDPAVTATTWAELAGHLDPCPTDGATRRLRCATPAGAALEPGGTTPVALPELDTDDGDTIDGTDCTSGWRHRPDHDGWTLTPGLPRGCLDVPTLISVVRATTGEPPTLDTDDDPHQAPTVGEVHDAFGAELPAGRDSNDPAHRGDLATALAAAGGPDWAAPTSLHAVPAGGATGDTTTVELVDLHPTATDGDEDDTPLAVTWPDVDGLERLCDPTGRHSNDQPASCRYRLDQPGIHHLPINIDSERQQRTVTGRVAVDPAPADLTLAAIDLNGPERTLTVDTDRFPGRVQLHYGDQTSDELEGDGWAATVERQSPRQLHIATTGATPDGLTVSACTATGGCSQLQVPPPGEQLDDVPVDTRTVAHISSPTVLPLPEGAWTVRDVDPHLTLRQPDGTPAAAGDQASGQLLVAPHRAAGHGLLPGRFTLEADSGARHHGCIRLDGGEPCPPR